MYYHLYKNKTKTHATHSWRHFLLLSMHGKKRWQSNGCFFPFCLSFFMKLCTGHKTKFGFKINISIKQLDLIYQHRTSFKYFGAVLLMVAEFVYLLFFFLEVFFQCTQTEDNQATIPRVLRLESLIFYLLCRNIICHCRMLQFFFLDGWQHTRKLLVFFVGVVGDE